MTTDGQTDGQSTSACVELRFAAKKWILATYYISTTYLVFHLIMTLLTGFFLIFKARHGWSWDDPV